MNDDTTQQDDTQPQYDASQFDPSLSTEEIERVELAHLEALLPVMERARDTMADSVDRMLNAEALDAQQYKKDMEALDAEAEQQVASINAQADQQDADAARAQLAAA